MAEILEGLLLINQTDVYARFGAFLAETGEDRHDNYDSLLAPPALKQQAEVSIREDKPFLLKPATDVQFRLDPVKFYKLHLFEENDFFESSRATPRS